MSVQGLYVDRSKPVISAHAAMRFKERCFKCKQDSRVILNAFLRADLLLKRDSWWKEGWVSYWIDRVFKAIFVVRCTDGRLRIVTCLHINDQMHHNPTVGEALDDWRKKNL